MSKLLSYPMYLTLIVLFAGCGIAPQADYGAVELIQATGTITLDGEPLPDAVVTFDSEDGQFSYALTDDSGSYRLNFDSVMKGVTPGKKIIRISTTRKVTGLNSSEEGASDDEGATPENAQRAAELVPAKYNRQSELTTEVTSEQTTYDFKLSSK